MTHAEMLAAVLALPEADMLLTHRITDPPGDEVAYKGSTVVKLLHAEREKAHKVMRQALAALEYHTRQTRPIVATDMAIDALRRALQG